MTNRQQPAHGAETGATPSRAPAVAAILTLVEALVVLGFAAFYAYELVVGAADSATAALSSGVLILITGVALLYLARGWARRSHWPRTPTIVWNALFLPVAWSLFADGQAFIGLGTTVLALGSIVAALASPSRAGFGSEDDVA